MTTLNTNKLTEGLANGQRVTFPINQGIELLIYKDGDGDIAVKNTLHFAPADYYENVGEVIERLTRCYPELS